MKNINLIIAILIILLVTSCSNGNGKPFQKDEVQEKAITVLIQEIVPGDLEKYIRITGKLEGITDVTVISETSGKIVSINKKLGDWINAGESLGRIDNSDYLNQFHQAEANYLAAESAFETATIQMQVSGLTAEAGRALNAFRITAQGPGERRNCFLQRPRASYLQGQGSGQRCFLAREAGRVDGHECRRACPLFDDRA